MAGLIGAAGEQLYPPESVADQTIELSVAKARIAELECAVRAALSFVQERHTDHSDGHAQMVAMALRGALRLGKVND